MNHVPFKEMNMTADAGKKAPDFKMTTDTGSVSLKDLKGKKIVLYFYPKDDTSGCTKEAIEFSALKKDFDKLGAVVIGVSKDSAASHGKFRTKHKLNVELGADDSGEVCEAYGVWVEKSMYGKKYMGIERSTFLIGADGKIAHIWRKVKVPDHASEVLAAVKAL
jgi:thioredoxin-dependent peroxiredoxin